MREIKYRGYRNYEGNSLYPPDKRWIYGYYYFEDGKHWIRDINDMSMHYVVEEGSVGQFIGIPDKNHKEIYEGDRVTHPLCVKELHDDEPCETFIGDIVFDVDRGQYFAVNIKRNGYVIIMSEAYKFEVIGNIHEVEAKE